MRYKMAYSEQQYLAQRYRDFLALGTGAVGVFGVLCLSGALDVLECLTATLVLLTGFMAYFIGTQPADTEVQAENTDPANPQTTPETLPNEIDALEELLMSLPFAALAISQLQRIEIINAHALKVLGVHDASGKLTRTVIRQPDLLAATLRVSQTGAPEKLEFTLHANAETWMAHIQAIDTPGRVVIILEDRTEVRRAERARADFLANASHELRTPLTALAGFIETMRGPAKNDKDSWDNFLEIMQQQTERMKRLVADLLSLSRIEFSEHRAPDTLIDLNAVALRCKLGLDPIAAEKHVSLKLTLPEDTLWAIADEDEIIQLIQNLISNAIKYSAEGRAVHVTLSDATTMAQAAELSRTPVQGARRVQLLNARASREAPAAWIRVRDTGSGIAEKHLPRLGERFYRVDESRGGKIEGTGLGLAIVKHIIARHRGGFAVESLEDVGTAFTVWIPRIDKLD